MTKQIDELMRLATALPVASLGSMGDYLNAVEALRTALGVALKLSITTHVSNNPEQEHIRELLIQAAAMAIVLERKGQYQSATKVADAILECEASALSMLQEVLCDPTGECSIVCSDGDKEIINTALAKLKGKSQ